jgi:arylsulfatase A-like enzyme
MTNRKRMPWLISLWILAVGIQVLAQQPKPAQSAKPNILIIWGDDIGQFNISAYNMGMMGYKTPNIDSIAKQGALFTDWYGQQSCTAGRAAFITGQSPIRTGLTKVCSSRSATRPASLARTTSVTAMTCYPRFMVLMSG